MRWERPTARSFWNALADPEREALAAAGVEEVFRAGVVLCREGEDTSQVMIVDSGWVKVSVREGSDGAEKILAVRGQGDVVGERAALTGQARSTTVTALDEVSAMVIPAERFAEFLRSHRRAAEVLQRQMTERRDDRTRLFPGERVDAERRLAWLLLDLAQRRGGYQHTAAAMFTLPMSHQELAEWAGTSPDAVARFLRSWQDRGIIARGERFRRLTVIDLDGLAALCNIVPAESSEAGWTDEPTAVGPAEAQWQHSWREPLSCSILFADVAGFSDPMRNEGDRDVVRAAMYEILQSCFDASGVPWAACYREDRGDGAVIVVPPTISPRRMVDPLMAELADRLRHYNRRASEVVRIQLRVALHVGPVGRDAEGIIGQTVIAAARMIETPVIKARLAAEQADLIFAVSDYVYDHVIRGYSGRVDPAAFEHFEYQVKESHVSAWMQLFGRVTPSDQALGKDVQSPWPESFPSRLAVAAPLGKLPPEVRGRDGLIGELRRALRPYPRRASRAFVLAGMGGIGKSTLALATARMARERGYRVWWMRATDTALLTSGMLEVLRELGAPESVTAPVREGARNAPTLVWEFLNGKHVAGRRWLLVLDGADNPAVLAGPDADTPADGIGWLQADPAGMVIVTTRTRDPQVWGTRVTLREVKPLDDEAGAETLRDLAPGVADAGGREARELSRRLGGLPLALHLAGAYLGSPFARWSTFADYHKALDGVELPAALTDIEEQGADIRDMVGRTWDLSLDALAAEGLPQARPLLLVLSCFAPATPIPAWLLHLSPLSDLLSRSADLPMRELGGSSLTREIEARSPTRELRSGSELEVGEDIAGQRGLRAGLQGLSRTGLIDISASGGPAGVDAVTVHPVVADANRVQLAASAAVLQEAVQGTAVGLLEAATARLDPIAPGDWPAWRLLMPHMNAAIDLLADDLDAATLAQLLMVSAIGTEALLSGGRLAAAEKLAQTSIAAATLLSRDHPAALTARGYLARTLIRHGRSGDAETIYRELLADRIRVQGEDHLDTLATRHDLAAALGMQGHYVAAEELYRQLIADDYRLRGPDHRETLAARYNLARMIGLQGRYTEAEELSRQVLEVQHRILGPDHLDTLASRQHLAWLAGKAGHYTEAEAMYRRVLTDRRRVLGDDHPDTLATRHRMARTIGHQGRYGEAEELCYQILENRRRLLGDDHSDNLSTRHRLARMLGIQGRYAAAENRGDSTSQHRLGWLVGRQGRYSEALGGRRNAFGDDHPDTLAVHATLAWLTGLRGQPAEAAELAREVLADRRRVLGDDHPDTLTTRSTLAWTAELRGRYADAEQQYRDVLADRERILGPSHPDTLTARQDVARMLGMQHRYAEAEQLSREVLADRRRLLGDDHPDVVSSRAVLARLAARQGRRAEAEELYRQVIADRTRVLGPGHPDTAAVRAELAKSRTASRVQDGVRPSESAEGTSKPSHGAIGDRDDPNGPTNADHSTEMTGEVRRFLECRSPRNVRVASEFAIVLKVTEHKKNASITSFLMPDIPAEGTPLYVLLDAPPGCAVVTDAIVQINLPARGDSDEAWFLIRAPQTIGSYCFTVTVLWAGVRGQMLAREPILVSVSNRPTEPMNVAMYPTRTGSPDQSEAGLAVARISGRRYLYFLNRPGHTPVHEILTITADPRSQLKQLTADLSKMARGVDGWRPGGMKDELRARGTDLWRDFVPEKIRDALGELRPGDHTLTISCTNSTLGVPWEMMHPLDPIDGCSDFLVQLFDVMRSPESTTAWCPIFALQPTVIVLPDDQLPGAIDEAHAIGDMLGVAPNDRLYIREKTQLQQELRHHPFGLLHVVSHDRDGLGTISLAARQKFAPSDLNEFAYAAGHWSRQRPLIFVNACATATSRQRFTQFTSWAQSFFESGAGGFIGSMWDVRSDTASLFAQKFYQAIYNDGLSFSRALHEAREYSRSRSPDPTWLAYAAHGDHLARVRQGVSDYDRKRDVQTLG